MDREESIFVNDKVTLYLNDGSYNVVRDSTTGKIMAIIIADHLNVPKDKKDVFKEAIAEMVAEGMNSTVERLATIFAAAEMLNKIKEKLAEFEEDKKERKSALDFDISILQNLKPSDFERGDK